MIQAWFTTSDDARIPALVPDAELLEIARMVGMSESDLFSIDIPSGASREGRVRCLVSMDSLATLYGSSETKATFRWQENNAATLASMTVWLLPPKPVFMVPNGSGVAIVEGVDARYWWKRSQLDDDNALPAFGQLFSSDGRWNIGGWSEGTSPKTVVQDLRDRLILVTGGSPFTIGGYNPPVTLINRLADSVYTPECSVAMALDMVLAATGWMLQYNLTSSTFVLTEIGDDSGSLGAWMAQNKRAIAGGTEATSDTPVLSEPLMALWQTNADYQINRMPQSATVSFPYRNIEGKTRYNNTDSYLASDLRFPWGREFGWETLLLTPRPRAQLGALTLKEPRSLVATHITNLDPTNPTINAQTSMPGWDFNDYYNKVSGLLAARCAVLIGQTAWAGWVFPPTGAYRCTSIRWTLGTRNGQLVPYTVTIAKDDDWILGPNGVPTSDPKDIAFSKGMVHARRLWSGALQLDVAPPNVRIFPARILGATPMGESCPWQWTYSWIEVEPNPCGTPCPPYKALESWARSGTTARNLSEAGNVYGGPGNVLNIIAPGVYQIDIPEATIEALPISQDTIVMMAEQFPTAYTACQPNPPPYGPQYWFSMPNAIKSTCNTPPS